MLKKLKKVFNIKLTSALKRAVNEEDQLIYGAARLCDEIKRLEELRCKIKLERENALNNISMREAEIKKISENIKYLLENGLEKTSPKVIINAKMALSHEAAVKHYQSIVNDYQSKFNQIVKSTADLSEKLEVIRANLELVRLNKESKKLGIENVEMIDYKSSMVCVDVDATIREIEVFSDKTSDIISAPNANDIDKFINSIK